MISKWIKRYGWDFVCCFVAYTVANILMFYGLRFKEEDLVILYVMEIIGIPVSIFGAWYINNG